MPKPTANDINVYARFQKVNRSRVPKKVWADVPRMSAARIEAMTKPANDFVDSKPR